jgi:hypothetical protein
MRRKIALRAGQGDGAGAWQTLHEASDEFALTQLEVHPVPPLAGRFVVEIGTGLSGSEEPVTGLVLVQGGTFAWTPVEVITTKRLVARVLTGPVNSYLRLEIAFPIKGSGVKLDSAGEGSRE